MSRFYVTYYIENQPRKYAFVFHSSFAAIKFAREFSEKYHIPTDVMDFSTGEIIAVFEI